MIGTSSAIIAPNIDTQLSKIMAIRNRSAFVVHPLYTTAQFRTNGSHTSKTADRPLGSFPEWGSAANPSRYPPRKTTTAMRAAVVSYSD